MSYRRRNVKKIEWTETPISRAPSMAIAARSRPRRTGYSLRSTGEFKSVDTTVTLAADTGTAVQLLNGIARGDDIHERNGRELTMESIQLYYKLYSTAATGVKQRHRILLVYDKQTNAAALTAAQVLMAADDMALKNLENRKRFVILMDRSYILESNVDTNPGTVKQGKYYKRVNLPMTFNAGDAGTVADIVTGSLYFIVIGTSVAGATAGSVQLRARIRYRDN